MHEHLIRDYLASNLDTLAAGLELVGREFKVEPIDGSRGYIDILATSHNKYVVIEVKRSEQSARSTTNEICKYVEGLKRKLALNEADIRVMVVSTSWRELTVPFAYMAGRLGLPCEGYAIEWNNDAVTSVNRIQIPEVTGARLFSPEHGMYMYRTRKNLKKGIQSVEEIFAKRGIDDYVTLLLQAPLGHHARVATANRQMASAMGLSESIFDGKDEEFNYSLYIAFLRKGLDYYRKRLENHPVILEQIAANTSKTAGEEAAFCEYECALWNQEPYPYSDWVETVYPAKLATTILEGEGWLVREVRRYGSLKHNSVLSDDGIISEMCGHQGVSKGIVKSHAQLDEPSELRRVEDEVWRCLEQDNIVWREHILYLIRKLRTGGHPAGSTMSLTLLSPNNFLVSLFNQLRDDEFNYLPFYEIAIKSGDGALVDLYLGRVVWSGVAPDFSKVIKKYFEGRVFNLAMTMNWGGFTPKDSEVMAELGLSYATFRVSICKDVQEPTVDRLLDYKFVDGRSSYGSLKKMLAEHRGFLEELLTQMSIHVRGNVVSSHEGPLPWE